MALRHRLEAWAGPHQLDGAQGAARGAGSQHGQALRSGSGAGATADGPAGGPPALRPASPARALKSLGAGLGAAAAAAAAGGPAGAVLAQFAPNWQRWDNGRRGGGGWQLFGPGRRVTETLMGVNVGMYALQQAYPGLVFKLARVRHVGGGGIRGGGLPGTSLLGCSCGGAPLPPAPLFRPA